MDELSKAYLHHHVIVDTDVINKAKWVEFLKLLTRDGLTIKVFHI